MTLRYIGSKSRLHQELSSFISAPNGGRFVDAFCGMGSVALMAAEKGWPILLNDHLHYAITISRARLLSQPEIAFSYWGGYDQAIATLNDLEGIHGPVWTEYSPASLQASEAHIERRYFTEANASRIDAIRAAIQEWRDQGFIEEQEFTLLIADLLEAANKVANIAGTYGCFLSKWTSQSQRTLQLQSRPLREHLVPVEWHVGDVKQAIIKSSDTVYMDPPYTKRQYASYYHLLETITLGDHPIVEGVAGLRPWHHLASDFCYKRKALQALSTLIHNCPAHRLLLSYSNEGHVDLTELQQTLHDLGTIETHPLKTIGRYRPNVTASATGASVKEYMMVIERHALGDKA